MPCRSPRAPRFTGALALAVSLALPACGSDAPSGTGGSGGESTGNPATGSGGSDATSAVSTSTSTSTATSTGTSGGAGGTGGSGGTEIPGAQCAPLCATQATLECPPDPEECLDDCAELAGVAPWCAGVTGAFLDCTESEPASAYACFDGMPLIVNSSCEDEIDGLLDCWLEGPVPDMTADCAKACALLDEIECSDPGCAEDCIGFFADPEETCKGGAGALVHCLGSSSASSFTCTAAGVHSVDGTCALALQILSACGD